jgi:hypothetical protein
VDLDVQQLIDRACSDSCDRRSLQQHAESMGVPDQMTSRIRSLPDGTLSREQVAQHLTGDGGSGFGGSGFGGSGFGGSGFGGSFS